MSELTNPLFEEEKEFLERKKLEYERALRGDMEVIKEKSATVGRVALVGAGLTGSIILITKLFSGGGDSKKKSKKKAKRLAADYDDYSARYDEDYVDEDAGPDNDDADEAAEYYSAGNGKRYKSKHYRKSAYQSATVFLEDRAAADAADDEARQQRESAPRRSGNILSDSEAHAAPPSRRRPEPQPAQRPEPPAPEPKAASATPASATASRSAEPAASATSRPAGNAAASFRAEDDPFQDLPYDDSRRLPDTHTDFADQDEAPETSGRASYFGGGTRMLGSVLQTFLASDTGKMLVAQAGAVVLAMVTQKISEFLPADKNDDLAVSPGYEPVKEGFSPTTSEPAHPSDEFTDSPPQPQDL